MENTYKISACRGHKQQLTFPPSTTSAAVAPRWLPLFGICLLLILTQQQVSGRPSDAASKMVAALSSPAAPSHRHHSHHKRHAVEIHPDEADFYEDYMRVKQCLEDEDVNELCQRCSKVIKSSIVFPMCCSNEDETRNWCSAYVYYGIQT